MSSSLDEYLEDQESRRSGLFSNTSTPIFDGLFGIILPILCLGLEQGIFHPTCYGPGDLAVFANYFYVAVGVEITALTLWLMFYDKIKYGLEIIAGVFFVGISVVFIPIISTLPVNSDVITWVLCLGITGILPAIIAFVYLRNGVRALRRARRRNPSHAVRQLIVVLASMLIVAVIVPAFVRWQTPSLFSAQIEPSIPESLCSHYSNQ